MRALIISLALLATGCSKMTGSLDCMSFKAFGHTIFGSPGQVTMKEIHLDNGTLLGREIVVEGNVVSIGDHATHLTIADQTARMLVVLTDLAKPKDAISATSPKMLRVLGTVERGKKGLPYVLARALSPMEPKKS